MRSTMDCWIFNTDEAGREFLRAELAAGRLRQGWGYEARLDLRLLRQKVLANEKLDVEEDKTWRVCRAMLAPERPEDEGFIRPGDLAAVKNLPEQGFFTLAEVADRPYEFDLTPELDYGHVRRVVVGSQRVFSYRARSVPQPLAMAIQRQRWPIRRTLAHRSEIQVLFGQPDDQTPLASPEEELLEAVLRYIGQQLPQRVDPTAFERVVERMLRSAGYDVTRRAGPNEQGADVTYDSDLGFGLRKTVAVQIKLHTGVDDDTEGLDQIERAAAAYRSAAGLLVSAADQLGPAFERRLAELRKTCDIEVVYGRDLWLAILKHLVATRDNRD